MPGNSRALNSSIKRLGEVSDEMIQQINVRGLSFQRTASQKCGSKLFYDDMSQNEACTIYTLDRVYDATSLVGRCTRCDCACYHSFYIEPEESNIRLRQVLILYIVCDIVQ